MAIAIVELDALGVARPEAQALSDRLRYELHSSGSFTVIERALMDQILKEQDFQQTGCVSTECIVEVGKILAVENMLGGSISKVGSTYSVSVRLVSVETGEIVGSAQKDFHDEIDYLLTDGMAIVANDLITSIGAKRLRQLTVAKMPLADYGPYIIDINLSTRRSERLQILPNEAPVIPSDATDLGFGLYIGKFKNNQLITLGGQYFRTTSEGAGKTIHGQYYQPDEMVEIRPDEFRVIPFIHEYSSWALLFGYKHFMPKASIPLQTMKSIAFITPFVSTQLELNGYNVVQTWYRMVSDTTIHQFEVVDSASQEITYFDTLEVQQYEQQYLDWDNKKSKYRLAWCVGLGLSMNVTQRINVYASASFIAYSNYEKALKPTFKLGIALTGFQGFRRKH